MSDPCDGLSISDKLFEFLVQAVEDRNRLESKQDRMPRPKRKHEVDYASVTGQIAALSYSVALIRNPYDPDAEGVLNAAEVEASER